MVKVVKKEKTAGTGFIIFGYVIALLGGWIGIGIGLFLWTKKVKIDGVKYPAYDETSRKHGKIMFTLGIILFIIYLIISFSG